MQNMFIGRFLATAFPFCSTIPDFQLPCNSIKNVNQDPIGFMGCNFHEERERHDLSTMRYLRERRTQNHAI
jgi:hypothetical protein